MDWRTFIASLADSLSWPAAVVLIFWAIRTPIAGLVPQLQELRFRDFRIKFAERASQAGEQLPSVPERPSRKDIRTEAESDLLQLLALSPAGAVLEMWRRVEEAVAGYLDVYGLAAPTGSGVSRAIQARVPPEVWRTYQTLRQLRNEAVHAPKFALDESGALEYWNAAQKLIAFFSYHPTP